MPKLRALRKQEDIDKVPADEPVTIELAPAPEPQETPEPQDDATDGKVIEKVTRQPEPEPEDDTAVLKQQLAELQKAEGVSKQLAEDQRKRADDAARRLAEREAELSTERETVTRERGGREQAEYDAVLNAIGAATTEAESAQRDLETAHGAGDAKLMGDAQRRLARSEARLVQLEDGKAAIEAQRESAKTAPKIERTEPRHPAADSIEAQIDRMPLSGKQKDWLKEHQDAFTDPKKNARLGAAHFDAEDAGHAAGSEGYFQFIEERLGYRKPAAQVADDEDDDPEPQPRPQTQQRRIPVSAPVSRETVSVTTGKPSSTKVTLSAEQREHAKISGVDELTYAKGVQEHNRRKAAGYYQERN